MRLSDLEHMRVVDADGTDIGSIDDVRLVQDGPILGAFGSAFRVDGLVIGHSASLGIRLGFHRAATKGPAPLKALFGMFERKGHFVAWSDVASVEDGIVRLRRRRDELDAPPPE